LAIDTVNVVWY